MMRRIGLMAGAAMMAFSTQANAATFLLEYGTGIVGEFFSATLTTTDTTTVVGGRNAYTITGISGTRIFSPLTGVLPAGFNFAGVHSDNYLFTTGPYFTDAGFGFTHASNNRRFNVYYGGNRYREYTQGVLGNGIRDIALKLTLTPLSLPAVPEAATWAMMIAGLGLVGVALRRQTRVTYAV